MSDTNKVKRNRRKKPENERRIQLAARVRPETRAYFEEYRDSRGSKNVGRALDLLVRELNAS